MKFILTPAFLFLMQMLYTQTQFYKTIDTCYSCGNDFVYIADPDNDGTDNIITMPVYSADGLQSPIENNKNITYYKYNGPGNEFKEVKILTADNATLIPGALNFTDWDSDGDEDIVSEVGANGNFPNRIGWYENNFPLTTEFTEHQLDISENVFEEIGSIYVLKNADFNNDGRPDLAFLAVKQIGSQKNTIGWFENAGSAAPEYHLIVSPANRNSGLSINDFDNDGDNDLLIYSTEGDYKDLPTTNLYLNDGTGNFSSPQIIYQNYFIEKLKIIDCDNDGDNDLAITFPAIDNIYIDQPAGMAWIENTDGNGEFNLMHIIDTTGSTDNIENADIDNNGFQDIIYTREGPLYAMLNNGAGTFSSQLLKDTEGDSLRGIYLLAIADIDGNGTTDIIHKQADPTLLCNFSTADPFIFSEKKNFRFLNAPVLIARTADLDTDTVKDLVVMDTYGFLYWYEYNNATANFEKLKRISPDNNPIKSYGLQEGMVKIGDFDLDGDNDIIAMRSTYGNYVNQSGYYENIDGEGNFEFKFEIEFEAYEDNLFADIDNDGDLDYFFKYEDDDYSAIIGWQRNDIPEGGTFTSILLGEAGGLIKIQGNDYDMDDDIDLVYSTFFDTEVQVYENGGAGNFENKSLSGTNACSTFLLADNDADNDNDIFYMTGTFQQIWDDDDGYYYYFDDTGFLLSENDGDGNFINEKAIINSPLPALNDPHFSDINGDGFSDITGWKRMVYNGKSASTNIVYYYNPEANAIDLDGDNFGFGEFAEFSHISGTAAIDYIGFTDQELFWKNYSDSLITDSEPGFYDIEDPLIYPNPVAGNIFFVFFKKGFESLRLYNISGSEIEIGVSYINEFNAQVTTPVLAKGLYLLRIKSENHFYPVKFLRIK